MEVLHCLVFLLEQDGLLCKIDLKNLCFSVPLNNISQKICQISMVRQQKQIFLPMFRIWTRSKKFYKIIESSSCCIEASQHWNNCLPRRNIANGKHVTRNSHGERHIEFLYYDVWVLRSTSKN